MTAPTGRLQFFTLEAGDYLERLALIAGRPSAPSAEEVVRLTRALRGAALMAGLSAFSQAASGLEQVAKAYRDGQWPWNPAHMEELAGAVERLQQLVRRAPEWNDTDTALAATLGRALVEGLTEATETVASRITRSHAAPDELPPSVRDFIAREGALVSGSLEHAAQALELGPLDQSADLVLRRLQPLRGLAALPSLTPLPDFLDAVELTLRTYREQAAPPRASDALRRVAAAISRLAREIAERGRAEADAADLAAAAASLTVIFGSDDDVVDVDTLFGDADATPIIRLGGPPSGDTHADDDIQLVALADRLRQAADQFEAAASETGRHLFLYGLLMQVRPLERTAASERPFLAPFLSALSAAICRGAAGRSPGEFAAHVRAAAVSLTRAGQLRDSVFLRDELAPATAGLHGLAPAPPEERAAARAAPPYRVPEPAPATEAPAPDAWVAEDGVVPIESLAPGEPPGLTAFEQSFSTLYRIERERRERRREPAPDRPPAPLPADTGIDVVEIEVLLYRGRRALERADRVRLELTDALKSQRTFEEVEPLVSELIDLVPLALAE